MNVAFIPVRGGSKSIPLKNIKIINGKPLVYWTIKAGCECEHIDIICVATDSEIVKDTVEKFCEEEKELFRKVKVIGRSAESATDTASTEFAMIEFANKYEFDNIVLIQATSPMLKGTDLDRGFEIYDESDTDSVLSAVPQKRFIWKNDGNNVAHAQNYDVFNRPRRQEFEEYYVENGAFYICSREDLLRTGNRLSGNIRVCPMDEDTFYEIDEPSDWYITEELMKKNLTKDQKSIVGDIFDKNKYKMLLTDCDGCLTDGGMYYSENGDELKKFNTKDGMGFKLLRESGIIVGVITGENRVLNRRRFEKLKIDVAIHGCIDKVEAIKAICADKNIPLSQIIYIGDDVNDLEVMKMVGLSCCPADANCTVKAVADYVANAKGGEGVIREIVDYLLNM